MDEACIVRMYKFPLLSDVGVWGPHVRLPAVFIISKGFILPLVHLGNSPSKWIRVSGIRRGEAVRERGMLSLLNFIFFFVVVVVFHLFLLVGG